MSFMFLQNCILNINQCELVTIAKPKEKESKNPMVLSIVQENVMVSNQDPASMYSMNSLCLQCTTESLLFKCTLAKSSHIKPS